MDDELSKSEKLFEEALDIVIRIQDDPDNPVAQELVNRWRARGPEHETARREAMEIYGMTGKVMHDQRRAAALKYPAVRSSRAEQLGFPLLQSGHCLGRS